MLPAHHVFAACNSMETNPYHYCAMFTAELRIGELLHTPKGDPDTVQQHEKYQLPRSSPIAFKREFHKTIGLFDLPELVHSAGTDIFNSSRSCTDAALVFDSSHKFSTPVS